MGESIAALREKFHVDQNLIIRFDNWTWSVRPTHCTLGAGILSLNRECTSFGSVTHDEATELADITREIEQRLKAAFNPQKMNYIMLMMVDPQLHFHVIPRYDQSRTFGGHNWSDNGWPALPALAEGSEWSGSDVLQEIKLKLKTTG